MKKQIFTLLLISVITVNVHSQYSIDDKKLIESSVFLNFRANDDGKTPVGSGFFFEDKTDEGEFLYLITAKHVLGDSVSNSGYKLKDDILYITYRNDIYSDKFSKISIDLKSLFENKFIKFSDDIAMCLLGKKIDNKINYFKASNSKRVEFDNDVSLIHIDNSFSTTLDNVKIGNDVFIVGYPRAIGIANKPQFNFNKPLVKKGIVAGIYKGKKTIIIDGSSFGGNSGGPVYGLFPKEDKIKLIGVVIQYIPFINELYINNAKTLDAVVPTNSGYSVALSAEIIEEILIEFRALIKNN